MIYFKRQLRRDRLGGAESRRKYIVSERYTPMFDKIWESKKVLFFYVKKGRGFLDFKGNFIK